MRFSKSEEVGFTSFGMPHICENQRHFFPNTFYGCHSILCLEDMIDSYVFYLDRGVEVANIKGVWKM